MIIETNGTKITSELDHPIWTIMTVFGVRMHSLTYYEAESMIERAKQASDGADHGYCIITNDAACRYTYRTKAEDTGQV